jgi:hypothetical protein
MIIKNKRYKRLLISISLIISTIFLGTLVFLYVFTKPTHIQHSFQSGVIVKDDYNTILDNNVNIELEGTISNTDFKLSKMALRKDLKGNIKINDKTYTLDMINYGSATHNLYWGALTENNSGSKSKPIYMGYITSDLNTIYLSQDSEKYHIAAPAGNIDDFNKIHEIINAK